MRKLILAACLFLIALSASAEINFLDNPVWSTVLEKAKKENKMIFLDGYATWCGPCKKMDKDTYTDPKVAEFYNANFINVRYDMEKGEGKMIAEKYDVQAYPNLLFLNNDGVMVHKGVGFMEPGEFKELGTSAKSPNTQYYTLKRNVTNLTGEQFERFAAYAVLIEDGEFDELANAYLSKQADILGNTALIKTIMEHVSSLPSEEMLAYVIKNKAKITKEKHYSEEEVEERLISLTLGYALSEKVQADQSQIDFEVLKKLLDKYIPAKSFFVYHYFKMQYAIDNKEAKDIYSEYNLLIAEVPGKVTFDQICNVLMAVSPKLAEEGKFEEAIQKFDALKVDHPRKVYMTDFIKAILYIKTKEFDKFKAIANSMIAKPTTPDNVKEDLKTALAQIN
jgi:thiol-disulfide isomerase/thioredoxin